jgi:hypothetical protein
MTIAALLLFIRTLGLTLPLWIVAGWSAAEAAIFFIVADVPISWIAVRSGTKAALLAAIDATGAAATMAALPGIDPALIVEAASAYHGGPLALLAGSFSGTPFKLFALEAAREHSIAFLLLAPLVRLPRFLAIALFVGGISRLLERRMTGRQRLSLLLVLWVAFYAWYFSVMPA